MSRVCICSDRIGAAGPVAAGQALARAFAGVRPGRDQVAVVPLAGGGHDLAESLAALGHPGGHVTAVEPQALGGALAAALAGEVPPRLLVDLTGFESAGPDAGVALADGLGVGDGRGVAELRDAVRASELIAVVAPGSQTAALLGVNGAAARHGYALGWGVPQVLDADARLARLAETLGVPDAPGAGASGGMAAVIVALGGRVSTGFALGAEASGLARTLAQADLVVVGTDSFTIGNFGGPVVLGLAPLAADLAVPCLAIAREVDISVRELRRHGVESAHPLGGDEGLEAAEIEGRAARVAVGWL